MEDLIKRIEAADGPDRELDRMIHLFTIGDISKAFYNTPEKWLSAAERLNWNTPPYTSSIDAAMTLVPEGCLLMSRTIWDANRNTAGLARIDIYSHKDGQTFWSDGFDAIAVTPALALCAAALRARIEKPLA